MDRIQAMQVFVRVVESGSFVRAAETLAMPPSSVTSMIKSLEKHLQVRLLNRTTRSLNLTLEGEQYVARCREILSLIEDTENSLNGSMLRPQGRLKVDMPGGIAHALIYPRLRDFQARYPNIYLMIGVNDRQIDLVQEGVDCVIRAGKLSDSTLVARPLGELEWVTCASPAYLEQHGTPTSPEDLAGHRAVHHFSVNSRRASSLHFQKGDQSYTAPLEGTVAVNETTLYIRLCIDGYGLGQLARVLVADQLRSGHLVEVLPDWRPGPVDFWFLHQNQRFLSPAVRAFSDWLSELFGRYAQNSA